MTQDLSDQLSWEEEMINFGISRFRHQQDYAKHRKNYTQTNAGARLLKGYLSQVSEFISHYVAGNNPKGRRKNKYADILTTVDADKLALFALTTMIQCVYEETSLAKVINSIGSMVEDELRFTKFELEYPELFDTITRAANQKNSANYRYRKTILVNAMNSNRVHWNKWNTDTISGVGALVLSLAMDASDIINKETRVVRGRRKNVLVATDEVEDWIKNSDEAVAVMLPDRMPCVIPPADWDNIHDGGYYSPRLRMTTSMVKTRKGPEGEHHKQLLQDAPLTQVRQCINAMQKTPWCVNERVLTVMQRVWTKNLQIGMPATEPYEIPKAPVPKGMSKKDMTTEQLQLLDSWKEEARELYTLEKKRKGNVLSVARTMRIAELLKSKQEFYYVYQTDFRGRIYAATSGVSPQGADTAKGVLQFANASELGTRGLYWLKVHGANKYGEDKTSYDDRVKWIDDRRSQWEAVAQDPIANRRYWKEADKPYQFLAFCFEYAEAIKKGPTFKSRLPIALDGSCNGLQHFSAMLLDEVGGSAVNLLPAEKPEDIYQEVADVCWSKLVHLSRENSGEGVAARNWIDALKLKGFNTIPRKLSKKPVMTLPYGSTQQACTSSIFEWCIDNGVDSFPKNTQFKHCVLLSKILWDSIGEVVIAARAAMKWIQDSAAVVSKTKNALIYSSPIGFPVYQGSCKQVVKRVRARVGGSKMEIQVVESTDEIDPRKQRQGSSPNLVHHVDACHLMMCVNAGYAQGITDFAMIHDDFGVPARYIDQWHNIIRQEFVNLHTKFNILEEFKTIQEKLTGTELPELPTNGQLDLNHVLDSPYFFG